MTTKELVTIGQRWQRNRSKEVIRIKQVHRADGEVEVTATLPLALLRKYYSLIDPVAATAKRSTKHG